MTAEHDPIDEARKLADEDVRRLLARASELEARQATQLTVAELREVALEAGIAPNAFERAVVELHSGPAVMESEPVKRGLAARSRFTAAVLWSAKTMGVVLVTLLIIMFLVDWLD